jgi:hypothetical protein
LESLEGIGGLDLLAQPLEPLADRIGSPAPAPLGLVSIESLEIAANGSTLLAPFGQRRLVLVGL